MGAVEVSAPAGKDTPSGSAAAPVGQPLLSTGAPGLVCDIVSCRLLWLLLVMHVRWPDISLCHDRGGREPGAFDVHIGHQKLRVVLDTALQPDADGRLDYLLELLQLDRFEVLRQLQAGETSNRLRFWIEPTGLPDVADGLPRPAAVVRTEDPQAGRSVHIIPVTHSSLEAARNRAAEAGMDPQAAAQAALLAGATSALGADIFVTERKWLLTATSARSANPVSVSEALAVVGLHMRSTGWTTLRGPSARKPNVDLDWTELVQSWTLLPAVRDVVSHAPADQPWAHLLREVVHRLSKMLRARDRILLAALTIGGDRRIDMPSEVESVAVSAMGAFDIVARAANMAVPLGLKPQQCSFWNLRTGLQKRVPAAGAVVDDPAVSATVQLVAGLRNTVHAEPLKAIGYGTRTYRSEQRVLVAAGFADEVRSSSQQLGREKVWLEDFGPAVAGLNGVIVHPQRLANDLTPLVATAVNRLVSSIPWSRDPQSRGWDACDHVNDPMAPDNARRIHWLYGLSGNG